MKPLLLGGVRLPVAHGEAFQTKGNSNELTRHGSGNVEETVRLREKRRELAKGQAGGMVEG